MTFKEGQQVDLAALKDAAKRSGFELLGTDLVVTGALVRATGPAGQEALGLRVSRTGQTFFLGPGDSEETRRNYTEVRRWMENGKTRMRIRGRSHGHPGAAPGLVISKFEVVARRGK